MDSCETNRDHVVRDLRYLKSYGKVSNNQTIYEIAESALELLKEQEAVKPINAFKRVDGTMAYSCPRCAALIVDGSYCKHCGQAVKWE